MKKLGFTLAEIIITLGIIGIVAAMTIPSLFVNYQKKRTVNQLKKAYSELSQAIRLSENDNGELSGWNFQKGNTPSEIFEQYITPYLKISKSINAGNSLKYYECSKRRETGLRLISGASTRFKLLSGSEIIVSNQKYSSDNVSQMDIIIDLNGYNSLPNQFGKDAFFIMINKDKGLLTMYEDDGEKSSIIRNRQQLINGPSAFNYQCNKNGRGMWCGKLIQQDGWQISKDYPW